MIRTHISGGDGQVLYDPTGIIRRRSSLSGVKVVILCTTNEMFLKICTFFSHSFRTILERLREQLKGDSSGDLTANRKFH